MTRIDSTQVRWRVQVRKSRAHKWQNKGLFETRDAARKDCEEQRGAGFFADGMYRIWNDDGTPGGYGFGNTRVLRHVGKGKA